MGSWRRTVAKLAWARQWRLRGLREDEDDEDDAVAETKGMARWILIQRPRSVAVMREVARCGLLDLDPTVAIGWGTGACGLGWLGRVRGGFGPGLEFRPKTNWSF